MKKQELYEMLVARENHKGPIWRYLGFHKPKIHATLTKHLGDTYTSEDLFLFLNPKARTVCKECGVKVKFQEFRHGYRPFCGRACANRNDEVFARKREVSRERYGTDHPWSNKEVLAKRKATTLERYGVENPQQVKSIRKKTERTNLKRYGGVAPAASEEVRKKIGAKAKAAHASGKYQATCRSNYGTDHPFQNSKVLRARKLKRYWFEYEGKRFSLQGYEKLAVPYLVKRGVPLQRLNVCRRTFVYREKGKDRYYHPDFEVKGPNRSLIVEVKSEYTAGLKQSHVQKNVMRKAKAVVEAGDVFLMLVFDGKGLMAYALASPSNQDLSVRTDKKRLKEVLLAMRWKKC